MYNPEACIFFFHYPVLSILFCWKLNRLKRKINRTANKVVEFLFAIICFVKVAYKSYEVSLFHPLDRKHYSVRSTSPNLPLIWHDIVINFSSDITSHATCLDTNYYFERMPVPSCMIQYCLHILVFHRKNTHTQKKIPRWNKSPILKAIPNQVKNLILEVKFCWEVGFHGLIWNAHGKWRFCHIWTTWLPPWFPMWYMAATSTLQDRPCKRCQTGLFFQSKSIWLSR